MIMRNIYIELFVFATIISHNLISGSKNSAEHISQACHGPKLISIDEWFRKVGDPKFDCNQFAKNEKIGT